MPIRPPVQILGPLLLERDRLIYAIGQTIDVTFAAAEVGCANGAGEVDRLVYFFMEGLPALEDQFNRILDPHGLRATVCGIFCHQTPRAEPQPNLHRGAGACELGDMLFLSTYGRRMFNRFVGNALLTQAKEDVRSVRGSVQEHLYEAATDFVYQSPRPLAGRRRWLGDCQHSLWYWNFDNGHVGMWPLPYRWHTEGISSRRPRCFRHHAPFEHVLGDLICGVAGRRVRMLEATSNETGWSKIVDDLIRVTARSAFRRQNAYVSRDREPLRGEDAIRAVNASAGNLPPFLIRSSLGRVLSIFDHELAKLGQDIEHDGSEFNAETFFQRGELEPEPKSVPQGSVPPPSFGNKRPVANDDDDGGCSFVIMDFSPGSP